MFEPGSSIPLRLLDDHAEVRHRTGAMSRQQLVYHDHEFAPCSGTAGPSKKVKI
jgi:hypothetical protein